MAVVQYSAIVAQMRGKVGGSVFNKSKNAFTLQKKQQQPKGSRGFQSEVRNFFSRFQRSWKSLTNTQRVNWQTCANNNPARDRFGNLTTLSGYNQFVKASMLAEYAGAALPTSPFTGAAPANSMDDFNDSDLAFSQNALGQVILTIGLEITNSSFGVPWYVIFDVGLPVSAGVMTYHGRWSHVGGEVLTEDVTNFFGNINLGTSYPLPVVGQKLRFRARLLHATSGTVVQELFRDKIYEG